MDRPPLDDPYYERLRVYLITSREESDRGQALVAASLIEEMLEEVLRAFLLDCSATYNLFDARNAPLSTFSAKISSCRALGLISAGEHRDMELMRKVRNAFAHSVLCSFADPKVSNWSRELKTGLEYLDGLEKEHEARVTSPKARFSMVTASLVSSLYNRAYHVRQAKLTERIWPS